MPPSGPTDGVHLCVILELNVSSYRMEAAKKRTQKEAS